MAGALLSWNEAMVEMNEPEACASQTPLLLAAADRSSTALVCAQASRHLSEIQ